MDGRNTQQTFGQEARGSLLLGSDEQQWQGRGPLMGSGRWEGLLGGVCSDS